MESIYFSWKNTSGSTKMLSSVSKGSWALPQTNPSNFFCCMYCFVLLSLSLYVSTIYLYCWARNNKNNDQFCWSVDFLYFPPVHSANKPSSDSEANNIYIDHVVGKQYIAMFSNLCYSNPKFTNVCKMLMMSTILEFIKWLVEGNGGYAVWFGWGEGTSRLG